MTIEKPQDPGDLLVALLKIGNQAAKDHGHSLEGKKVSIAPLAEAKYWKVVYGIIPPPGKVVVGGDLAVIVNAENMTVEGVKRNR